MKFEEIYIDGFGIFHDYHLKDLSPGITVFTGLNESGKSTILTFIKRILFGFPDKRSKENLYPPLAGGRYGGRIIVSCSNNKRYTVERYSDKTNDVKVIVLDGSTGGTSELQNIFGHMNNKNIFENVYAFSLTELQDFGTLNSKEIKERLYSAGKGTGTISISEILNTFEKEAGNLFKERGSKPEIKVLFREINEINTDIKEIKDNVQKFDELYQKQNEVIEKIKVTEKEQERIKTTLEHINSLLNTYKEIEEINLKKSKIKVCNKNLLDSSEKILELQKGINKYTSDVNTLNELEKEFKQMYEYLQNRSIFKIPFWQFISIGIIFLILSIIKKSLISGIASFVLFVAAFAIAEKRIRTGLGKQKIINNFQNQIESIQQFLKEYEDKVFSVLEICNKKKEDVNVLVELEEIIKELEQDKKNSIFLAQLEKDRNEFSNFDRELKETNFDTLQKKKVQLKGNLKKIENNISILRENLGGIREKLKQVEQSEERISLLMKKSLKIEELKNKAEKWSVFILAENIMKKAIKKYEREKQPDVIKKSQFSFSKMTLGRYSRIYAPFQETKIYVEDENGRRKDFTELSRGTVEQLYLSLRFGFIQEFNEQSESLPVIFDDILVNFDPERKKEACMAIRELAETNQVFYFTCHPETVDILSAGIPDIKKINL